MDTPPFEPNSQHSLARVSKLDFAELAGIRIEAMRESLEAVGRFDPDRARARLRSNFDPDRTCFILSGEVKIGFYATREEGDGLWLDHLYIIPSHQHRGIGSAVLRGIIAEANRRGLAVFVGALIGSRSNRFYLSHGFRLTRRDEFDNYYFRPADP